MAQFVEPLLVAARPRSSLLPEPLIGCSFVPRTSSGTIRRPRYLTRRLPAYISSINKSPSYQLTAVGAPMPMLHVAAEISADALRAGEKAAPGETLPLCWFRIAGGVAGGRVSWRVEALRNDRWVQQHGAPVEVEKQDLERGRYQHPELYGQPAEKGMDCDVERDHLRRGPLGEEQDGANSTSPPPRG